MKKTDAVLKEYVRSLSDEDIRFLNNRFQHTLCGDRADIADMLSKDKDVDRWLSSATSATEWFEMLEIVGQNIVREAKRRYAILKEQRDNKPRDKPHFHKRQPAANAEAS